MVTIRAELAKTLAIIGRTMQSYQTDLLYDFACCLNKFEWDMDYTMFVWKNGTHSKDTYDNMCKSDGIEEPTIEDCIDRAKRTLGVDYVVTLKKHENHIKVELINVAIDEREFKQFEAEISRCLS